MAHVGFDEYTSSLIYTMGEGSLSQPMLNGGIAQPILILKSVNQGCSLNLFLFAILTHSIFVILYNMAIESRYSFPYHYANDALCKHHQIITLCFQRPCKENIKKAMPHWGIIFIQRLICITNNYHLLYREKFGGSQLGMCVST